MNQTELNQLSNWLAPLPKGQVLSFENDQEGKMRWHIDAKATCTQIYIETEKELEYIKWENKSISITKIKFSQRWADYFSSNPVEEITWQNSLLAKIIISSNASLNVVFQPTRYVTDYQQIDFPCYFSIPIEFKQNITPAEYSLTLSVKEGVAKGVVGLLDFWDPDWLKKILEQVVY